MMRGGLVLVSIVGKGIHKVAHEAPKSTSVPSSLLITTFGWNPALARWLRENSDTFVLIQTRIPYGYNGTRPGPIQYRRFSKGTTFASFEVGTKFQALFSSVARISALFLQVVFDLVTMVVVLRSETRFDCVISTNLNPFLPLLRGITQRLILVSGDNYIPIQSDVDVAKNRGKFKLVLNGCASYAVVAIDKLLQDSATEVWYLSKRLFKAKTQTGSRTRSGVAKKIVPLATSYVECESQEKKFKHSVVYLGRVSEGHGLEETIVAMKEVITTFPSATLHLLGGGRPSYFEKLRRIAEQLGISNAVVVYGYVPNERLTEEVLYSYMSRFSVAIAIYTHPQIGYTDPGKVKDYLSSGLPIIASTNIEIAKEIVTESAGIGVDATPDSIAASIKAILSVESDSSKFRAGARTLAAKYDYKRVYGKALADPGYS